MTKVRKYGDQPACLLSGDLQGTHLAESFFFLFLFSFSEKLMTIRLWDKVIIITGGHCGSAVLDFKLCAEIQGIIPGTWLVNVEV